MVRPLDAKVIGTCGTHQTLETLRDILWRKSSLIVGSLSDKHAPSAIDHDCARQHISAFRGLDMP